MAVALGTQVYDAGTPPVAARGYSYTQEELDGARSSEIPALLQDEQGLADLSEFCSDLVLTGFGADTLKDTLKPLPDENHSKGWREGEALAEAWLTTHRGCEFPWPFKRDLRHPRASLPGAELVGVCSSAPTDHLLVFGQVKTSKEAKNPPQVVTNKADGLVRQMTDLREKDDLKKSIILYLTYRALSEPAASWVMKFRSALTKYCDSGKLALVIFGVLLRDVAAKALDVSSAAEVLAVGCHALTRMELVALYLPEGSIASGPQHARRKQKEEKS